MLLVAGGLGAVLVRRSGTAVQPAPPWPPSFGPLPADPPRVTPAAEPAPPPSPGPTPKRATHALPQVLMAPAVTAFPAPGQGGPPRARKPRAAAPSGAAAPLPDGSPPGPEYTVKGAASGLFHAPSSPYYKRTRAELWFRSAEDARTAGFTEWAPKKRKAGDPRP